MFPYPLFVDSPDGGFVWYLEKDFENGTREELFVKGSKVQAIAAVGR
jgi:hypothetical protein